MGVKYLIILFLSFGIAVNSLSAQTVGVFNEAYKKGHEAVKNDNFEDALSIWGSVIDSIDYHLTDPRIGISYIELVTGQGMKDYYPEASELYYWGLTNSYHPNFESELSKEVKRLESIAEKVDYKYWNILLNDGQLQALGKAVISFWKTLDPTLNTAYNERLMEHWERIAYAKENFKRAGNTIFDTDDRALIYLKYGKADHIRNGILSYNTGQVKNWVQDAMQVNGTVRPTIIPVDSASRAAAQQQMRINLMQSMAPVFNYERQIRLLHRYPYYEIWVYKNILNKWGNLIYIFGDDGDTGEFGLRQSLEEMMPTSAFRSNGLQGMNIPPAYFLQLLFYGNMVTVDSYFSEAFNELENRLYSLEGPNRWTAFQMKSHNYSRLVQRQLNAPEEYSTHQTELPNITLDVYQYRLLNSNNEPYLATFVASRPHRAFYVDQIKRRIFDEKAYRVSTSVVVSDNLNKELFRNTNTEKIKSHTGNVEKMEPVVTYFEIPNPIEEIDQIFTVKLKNINTSNSRISDHLFAENVGGLGSISSAQKKPLSKDKNVLEMGDPIVGYKDETTDKKYSFGFKVQPDGVIPEGENLMIHFEIYHLKKGDSPKPVAFRVEYTVNRDRSFIGRLFGKKEKVKLSLNFEARSADYRDNLEVDTSPFDPGKYTLIFNVRDMASERQVQREIRFEIDENKK